MNTSIHDNAIMSIYILTFLTGLPSNLLAFYAFLLKVRQKQSPVDILLLNLTVSDLVLLTFLPMKMKEAASGMLWTMPQFLCPLTGFCYYSSIYISTLFLTAVSVERYLGVAYPIKYKMNWKPEYALVASFFFWLIVCIHCSTIYIVQYNVPSHINPNTTSNISKCYEVFSEKQLNILLPVRLEMCLVLFVVPFIITLFCYINFVKILMFLPNIQAQKKQRAIGLAVATLCNFIICFFPYNMSHVVGYIQNKSPDWRVYTLLLSTFNATLDPIIFYFSSTAVRRTFIDCFSSVLNKLHALMPCHRLCLVLNKIERGREEQSST
ncbi:LOW QUALITY PROTEIN: free fatty acid receptor 2-like [Rhinatrema bivittatum]|uniref:LOW QUALITY PROTEIN: free fatty acid receptor 2-like n=1 Tax=Rhinatrema bivittatum TaxID=194408 RepID=UPI00112C9BAD|nr:LOW QUALITY PROTEIN: free fatty acid receptor 2-like [Rhinatrema bivittatum]